MGSTGSTGTLPSIDPFRTTSHRIASRHSFFLDPFWAPSCHVASRWMFYLACYSSQNQHHLHFKEPFSEQFYFRPLPFAFKFQTRNGTAQSYNLLDADLFCKTAAATCCKLEEEGAVKFINNQVHKKSLFLYQNKIQKKILHNLLAQLQSTQPLLSS